MIAISESLFSSIPRPRGSRGYFGVWYRFGSCRAHRGRQRTSGSYRGCYHTRQTHSWPFLRVIPRTKCGIEAKRVWNRHSESVRNNARFDPLPETTWCAWISRNQILLIFCIFTMCTFQKSCSFEQLYFSYKVVFSASTLYKKRRNSFDHFL